MATATTNQPAQPQENFAALFEESLARQEMRQGELITAEVTREALVASRLENAHLADRRPELYRGTTA